MNSKKYGIVSLPWWFVMDYRQFKMYYHENITEEEDNRVNEDNGIMTAIAHPQMILSWLKYINFSESNTHSEPIPFIIDLFAFEKNNNDDSFYNEWSSFYSKGVDFCSNLVS